MMQPDWSDQLSDAEICRTVGAESFRRGLDYAMNGAVDELRVNREHQVLFGSVQGTRPSPYRVIVSAGGDLLSLSARSARSAHSRSWSGRCTCPMDADCKHVAAVMLAARASFEPAARGDQASWERAVAALVGPTPVPAAVTGAPLALQFELTTAPPTHRRYGSYGGPAPVSEPRRRIRLRPVTRGKSGKWVRTGVTWRDLQYDYGRSGRQVQAHREALQALFTAHLAHANAYYSYDTALYLDEFGPTLWPLLRQIVQAGVELVPTKAAAGAITMGDPASISLDLTRSAPSGGATLQPVITVGDTRLDLASVTPLGDPVHGIFAEDDHLGLLLAPLDEPPTEHVARLLRHPARIEIPAADLDTFLHGYYPGLRQAVPVTSSDESVALPEVVPPRLALTATYRRGHQVSLDWGFAYGSGDEIQRVPLQAETRAPTGAREGAIRDPRAEQLLLSSFDLPHHEIPQLVILVGGSTRLVAHLTLGGMDAVSFTQDLLPALLDRPELDVTVRGTVPDYRAADEAPVIALSTTDSADDRDWFDLGVSVSIDGEQIPFNDLFVALAGDASHLVLETGTYFPLDRPELEQLRRLIEEARTLQDRASDGLRLSVYQAGLWEELQQLGIVETQSRRWASAVQGLLDLQEIAPPAVPDSLDAELRPYQVDGYQWLSFLREHGLGGILADDMGLGKTMQTLAMICRAHEDEGSEPARPFLVVAPTSVVPGWVSEARRFAPELKVVAVTETARRRGTPLAEDLAGADLVVTSYALFRIDYDDYAASSWAGLILDEAQFVKNHQAKTYQCARRLPAPFKLAITGTPLENSLMDLWSLLSIVAPGLFPSPQRFSEHYRKPIEGGGAPELLATLRRRIAPLMRRRSKEQVIVDLPPKQEQVLEVQLNPRHQKIYQTHLQRERQKVLGLLGDLDKNRFEIFRSLTLLRQLSLDASLIDDAYNGVSSSKADALLEHLSEAIGGGHRALVFSQFTGFLRVVRDRLDAAGVPYCYLDGRTRNRGRRIDEFKDGDAPVFLISLKAGGVGLNLTEADYVFVLDPWWNPAVEAQAVDRTHRIGQDKTVMVYRLVATDTIEEKVMALKARKQNLFERVMDGDALLSAPLTADDIQGLFS